MIEIDIDLLKNGLPTMTPSMGGYLSEAAAFCLQEAGHKSGVKGSLIGIRSDDIEYSWRTLDRRVDTTHGDLQEATEYGAAAISILLSVQVTGYNTVERAMKGEGFDYWLGNDDSDSRAPFQRAVRLEVSGILQGNSSKIRQRIAQKHRQVIPSDRSAIPAIISVVEFGSPLAVLEDHE